MAERLGTSVQWLSRIEGGGENPTIETLVLFANTLGVPVIELITPGEPVAPTTKRGRPRKSG
jgi:transcriptional regulator with XRE-family HTH domain